MNRTKELRSKAALCRRTASVLTNGSTSADRALIMLAEALEHEAATIERLDQPAISSGSARLAALV